VSHPIGRAAKGLTALVLVAGCSKSLAPVAMLPQTESVVTAGRGQAEAASQFFYPLQVGNHWSYDNTFTFQIVPFDGPPSDPSELDGTIDVDLVGTAQQSGREYVIQRETNRSGSDVVVLDFLYRQDFSGLFNADRIAGDESAMDAGSPETVSGAGGGAQPVIAGSWSPSDRRAIAGALAKMETIRRIATHGAASVASGRGTPGPLEGEIALLRYPLHAGSEWQVREDPLVMDTALGMESLQLPAGRFSGWRIQIESEFFGPNDRAFVWYGSDGLIRLSAHAEGVATDENGVPYARIVSDTEQRLTALSLVGPPSP
jgi:hypothetical protein